MVDYGFQVGVVEEEIGDVRQPDADITGLELDRGAGDRELQVMHPDSREGVHYPGFQMRLIKAVTSQVGTCLTNSLRPCAGWEWRRSEPNGGNDGANGRLRVFT